MDQVVLMWDVNHITTIGVYPQLAADTPFSTWEIYLPGRQGSQLKKEVSIPVPTKHGAQSMGFSGLCHRAHIIHTVELEDQTTPGFSQAPLGMPQWASKSFLLGKDLHCTEDYLWVVGVWRVPRDCNSCKEFIFCP